MAEMTQHGFTPEMVGWIGQALRPRPTRHRRSFDRPTIMWIVSGITALDVAVADVFYLKISSIREEPQTEIGWVRDKVGSLRNQVTRIEAILDRRLPRGE